MEGLPELCPEFKEYYYYYSEEFLPKVKKVAKHIINCTKCQEILMSSKDKLAFQLLTQSDEKLLELLRGMNESSI